jgi:hypothetical protein
VRGALAIVAAVGVFAVPLAATADAPVYGGTVTCTPKSTQPARVCSLAADPRAVFRAFEKANVRYRVCVDKPRAKSRCRERRTGPRGRKSRAAINLTRPGTYTVTWRVNGKRVKRRGFRARAPRVFVNGDSLAVGTRPYLPRVLAGWPISQSTSISRQAGEGAGVLRAQGDNLAQILFISLGTNGSAGATDYFRDAIRAVMHVAGPERCVVWANIVRPGGYERLNAILAEENRHSDNLLVFDWVSMAKAHPYWFGPDGVHPTATGYKARARGIAEKIRLCLKL